MLWDLRQASIHSPVKMELSQSTGRMRGDWACDGLMPSGCSELVLIRVSVPSLSVVSSPALSRVRNKRQEKSARCLGLCPRILMGVPGRYERSLHSPSRAAYLGNSHCNYSDQRPISQLTGFWELPGVWALSGPVFVRVALATTLFQSLP